jgi:hypothetical protein
MVLAGSQKYREKKKNTITELMMMMMMMVFIEQGFSPQGKWLVQLRLEFLIT